MKLKLNVVIPVGCLDRIQEHPQRLKNLFRRLEEARGIAVSEFNDFEIVFHVGVLNPLSFPDWEKKTHKVTRGLPKEHWNTYQYYTFNRESFMYMLLDKGVLDGENEYITFIDDDDYVSKDYFRGFRRDFKSEYEAIYRTDAHEVDLIDERERLLRRDDNNGTLSSLYQNFTDMKTTFQIWGNFFPMKAVKSMFEDLKEIKFRGMWEDLVYWSYVVSKYDYPVVQTGGTYYYMVRGNQNSLSRDTDPIRRIWRLSENLTTAKKVLAKSEKGNFDLGWLEIQAYLIALESVSDILESGTARVTFPAFFNDFEEVMEILTSIKVTKKLQKGWSKRFFESTRKAYGRIKIKKLFDQKIGSKEECNYLTPALLEDLKGILE